MDVRNANDDGVSPADETRVVLPVIEEDVRIDKRRVETGKVRIRKSVEERDIDYTEQLRSDEVEVDRIAKNETIDAVPASRYEGDTLVIPVVEEVLEVRKKLVLKEEIRVRRKSQVTERPVQAHVRRESIEIDRVPTAGGASASADTSSEGVESWTRQS